MSDTAQQVVTFVGTALGLWLVPLALQAARKAWHVHHDPRDLSLSWAAGVWLVYLLTTTLLDFAVVVNSPVAPMHSYANFAAFMGHQALIVSVGFFLVTCSGINSVALKTLLVTQAACGAVAIYLLQEQLGNSWVNVARLPLYQAWIVINLASGGVLVIAMARRLYPTGSYNGWLSFAAGIIGLGLFMDGVWLADGAPHFSTFSHYCYAAFLLLVWRLVTQPEGQMAVRSPTLDFQNSSRFESLTDFGLADTASAVADERRRIAQDLHDGVCSQIVSILSSLNCRIPQQKALALALEHCLMELKMTIDATHSENDSLLDALGRLRYRVQHSLDKLGISMVWSIEMCFALEAVRGAKAQHALRITQESLANVMRHANASAVEVLCRFVPAANQMVLEVRDNGRGIPRGTDGRRTGKGLEGMRRRAHEAGGQLVISSRTGMGTRVKLTLVLTEPQLSEGVVGEAGRAHTYVSDQTVWH